MSEENDTPLGDLDLQIEQERLPEQWAEQPALMLKYGLLLADAERDLNETKNQLAVVAAELETDIRNNPADYEVAKLTEAVVVATIPQQKAHKKAMAAYNDARHTAAMYRAVVDALGHRKSALQGTTDLFMRQWFADPEARAAATQAESAYTKTVSRRVPRRASKD